MPYPPQREFLPPVAAVPCGSGQGRQEHAHPATAPPITVDWHRLVAFGGGIEGKGLSTSIPCEPTRSTLSRASWRKLPSGGQCMVYVNTERDEELRFGMKRNFVPLRLHRAGRGCEGWAMHGVQVEMPQPHQLPFKRSKRNREKQRHVNTISSSASVASCGWEVNNGK